jgi:4-hydroxy-3-methylbut-2-enyl diphosphate reductase
VVSIKRAEKYGFCAGVRIADRKVKKFAAAGNRAEILGQVVHNERVVEELTQLGVPTVDSIDETKSATIVFSAHGVPPSYHHHARQLGLNIVDTTCPFVYDIHREAAEARQQGYRCVFIGDPKHREVVGYTHDLEAGSFDVVKTVDEAAALDFEAHPRLKIFYQTTLNSEHYEDVARTLEAKAREAVRADTICYATKENQDAARELALDPTVEVIIVIGGRHSANTRHLWEICQELKPQSYLIHAVEDIDPSWFVGARTVGVTAGASTPEFMIEEVEALIQASCQPRDWHLGH